MTLNLTNLKLTGCVTVKSPGLTQHFLSQRQACQLPSADLVLQVLVSEISIRSYPTPPAPKKTPYKLSSVLQRMTFTGLVSALCSVMPGHRFPKEMSNELEELRQSVKEG